MKQTRKLPSSQCVVLENLVSELIVIPQKSAGNRPLQQLQRNASAWAEDLCDEGQFRLQELVIAAALASGTILDKERQVERVLKKLREFRLLHGDGQIPPPARFAFCQGCHKHLAC